MNIYINTIRKTKVRVARYANKIWTQILSKKIPSVFSLSNKRNIFVEIKLMQKQNWRKIKWG